MFLFIFIIATTRTIRNMKEIGKILYLKLPHTIRVIFSTLSAMKIRSGMRGLLMCGGSFWWLFSSLFFKKQQQQKISQSCTSLCREIYCTGNIYIYSLIKKIVLVPRLLYSSKKQTSLQLKDTF